MTSADLIKRRNFLRRACGFTLGATGFSALNDLRLIQSALAQQAGTTPFPDYKALICLFLAGGNDSNNLLIPNDTTEYAAYATNRNVIALANSPGGINSNSILPLSTANTNGRNFGIHANCPELQGLFNSGKLAFVANTGTLVEPITKTTYNNRTGRRPPQLESHNDQVVQWMTSIPDQISPTGWAGRTADLLRDNVGSSPVSMSISASGFNTWEVGKFVNQYQVPSAILGAASTVSTLTGFTNGNARANAIRNIIAAGTTSATLSEKDYAQVFDTAIDAADLLNTALGGISVADNNAIQAAFDGDAANPGPLRSPNALSPLPDVSEARSLAGQMKMIAKIIASRNSIGIKRQIFFCQIGGWDTHTDQFNGHNKILRAISRNIKALQDCTTAMGIADKVTLFTASDFGRTYKTNGAGSDHGWGTHTIVSGGAVQGGKIYGTFPTVVPGGPDDYGSNGRWIPTTAVDEYAATLARWFGVTEPNLDVILPNLYRFSHRNLGFLA
jgi:uncharacterized protein (DUF1501 family)